MSVPTIKGLADTAKTVRSKKAGVDRITVYIIFYDRDAFKMTKRNGALTRETVSKLCGIDTAR